MGHPMPINLHLTVTLGTLMMAVAFALIRLRSAKKPTNAKKIMIPPLGMSTGFMMFLYPSAQIPWTWAIAAFLTGAAFFSYPLIRTSRFQVQEGKIYLKRSKAFILILFVLLAVRMLAHNYVEHLISLPQTGGIFFILAFGMILPWRVAMYLQYKKLQHLSYQKIRPKREERTSH
ncbi:CcdC family protein [Paludifilum halophilum]|uniref:Cytochrome c biogenesis protein CcdC n=1 Tax=Paludifilum halophilum TaxID=1642702 RepID=A0A235B5X1_9BACL|nr:cytochrome c biogenesis protein CcdC [Paludifilum halophilum]OYD07642.1 hypothetical protein CHM34_09170 [Paludifilum halophilum]